MSRAPEGEERPRRPMWRRVLRGAGEALAIAAITLLLAEVALRLVLDVQPLTTEALVWQYHPRWGWAHRADSRDLFVKLGCRQEIEINSKGLREREIAYEKPPGLFRVLVIGDSAVAGFEVAAEEVFTRVAEDRLRARGIPVQFINGGHRGFGTDQSLLFLEDEGLRYAPDLVLYHWTDNDRDDNATIHRPFRRFGKSWFAVSEDGELELRGVPVPEFAYDDNLRVGPDNQVVGLPVSAGVRLQMWFRDYTVVRSSTATALVYVIAALPQLRTALRSAGSYGDFRDAGYELDRGTRVFRLTSALVRRMGRAAEASGADFRILGPEAGWADALRGSSGVPELGEHPLFRARIPPDTRIHVPMDPHLNALGHRLYGEALAEALAGSGLLPAVPETTTAAARAAP